MVAFCNCSKKPKNIINPLSYLGSRQEGSLRKEGGRGKGFGLCRKIKKIPSVLWYSEELAQAWRHWACLPQDFSFLLSYQFNFLKFRTLEFLLHQFHALEASCRWPRKDPSCCLSEESHTQNGKVFVPAGWQR